MGRKEAPNSSTALIFLATPTANVQMRPGEAHKLASIESMNYLPA